MQEETAVNAENSNVASTGTPFSKLIKDKELTQSLEELGFEKATQTQQTLIELALSGKSGSLEVESNFDIIFACAAASKVVTKGKSKTLLVLAPSAAEKAFQQVNALPIPAIHINRSGAPQGDEVTVADASLIVGNPMGIAAALEAGTIDANSVGFIVMSGLDIPHSAPAADQIRSEDVTRIMQIVESSPSLQRIWIAKSLPLAFMSLIKQWFQSEDCQVVRAEEPVQASTSQASLKHLYYEVSNDLTAKPNALCDLIESEGEVGVAVFCNSPSDADLVDVFLKRRGIPAEKLIGHVPSGKVLDAQQNIKEGKLRAVIVTDIAARHLKVEDLDLIINHSIHSDPEVYIHRFGRPEEGAKLKKVMSLVGATDVGNFHYLRKLVDFEFEKGELPSKGDMLEAKFNGLCASAIEPEIRAQTEALTDLVKLVKDNDESDQLIAYLLHNTLTVLPEALQSKGRRRGGKSEERHGRNSRNRRDSYEDDDYSSRSYDGDRDRDRGDRDRGNRRDQAPKLPPKKDVRIYIGHGLEQGLNEDRFLEILNKADGDTPTPERISIRDHYAFVDFDEACADAVLSHLEGAEYDGGSFVAHRATVISSPREAAPSSENATTEEGAVSEQEATPQESTDGPEQAGEIDAA